ncbi:hypothetical protein [Bordetella bronchiseptica]|uniref:hypothetical protein n=1 Tax=Bordetella bronchiseptica TaxID=518 RepID=UPI0004A157F7|nr:hypothetical protein [Bordetella bronchiseptica]KDC72818.1 hypothetical protein L513_3595 [Bordetella bronchiseptica MBORD632]
MTNQTQNNAAQAQTVLTDEEYERLWRKDLPHQTHRREPKASRYARAVESTLLSKLRAPVADERAAFERAMRETYQMVDPFNPPQAGSYARGEHEGIIAALKTVRENFTRSALASTPAVDERAPHIKALQDLRLGVEMDQHCMDDGDAKLAALDAAITALRWSAGALQALNVEADKITLDGETRTVGDILDHADRALASAPVAGDAQRLDAPAQVGGTRFGKGIHWSTVIHAAQRHHQYMQDPAREADRIAQAKQFRALVAGDAASQALAGCIVVQEADTVPHFHPEYGPGIFFTEDARIEPDAAPQASAYGHTQQPMDTSPGHSAPQAPAGWRWTLHPAGLHPDVYAAAAAHTSDEARNAALEEAAVIVETAPDYLQDSSFNGAARAIRALKSTPAPTAAEGDALLPAPTTADRKAWEADMHAAGARHLGGNCWEWDVDDFEYRLWQLASHRQQRAEDGQASEVVPTEPLRVFAAGIWTYDGTGQAFSHTDLDEAAFVTYRDRAALAARKEDGNA